MKTDLMVKRIIPLILAILMVSGALVAALPVQAHAAKTKSLPEKDIDMRRVSGYPRISFMKGEDYAPDFKDILLEMYEGKIPDNFDGLDVNDSNLTFNQDSFTYKNSEPFFYESINLVFAYADYNYPILKNLETEQPDKENTLASLTFDGIETEANRVEFGKSSSGGNQSKSYLITKIYFDGVDFFDDINDEVKLDLQYVTKDINGKHDGLTKGSTTYKFSRIETPDKPEDPDDNENPDGDGDVNFGGDDPEVPGSGEPEVDIKSTTPYIIIEEYSFGDSMQVVAGNKFDLNLVCKNTHRRINLENILMKVSTSDGLQLTNSSNTFYIKSLRKNDTFDKSLTISALPNAEAKSHTITVSFSYEYVADDARQKGEMSQEITIPVVQQDRFSADPITGINEMTVGEESDILSKYINKSRDEIFNLTATLECDEAIQCAEKIQHKGNVVAGGSGEMEFSLSATAPGTYTCAVVYTYEDSLANVKEVRVPFDITFIEAPSFEWEQQPSIDVPTDGTLYDENGNPIDPNAQPEGLTQNQKLAIIGGGALLLLILTAVIIKKRKAAHEFEDDDENI